MPRLWLELARDREVYCVGVSGYLWRSGLAAMTPPFHGGNVGSIPAYVMMCSRATLGWRCGISAIFDWIVKRSE